MQRFGVEEMTADMEHGFKHLLGVFVFRLATLRIKAQELPRMMFQLFDCAPA